MDYSLNTIPRRQAELRNGQYIRDERQASWIALSMQGDNLASMNFNKDCEHNREEDRLNRQNK